jgi:hypothetical protein
MRGQRLSPGRASGARIDAAGRYPSWMRWLRFFNPIYTLRLERQRAADARGIKSLVDSIGRQAPAGSETELRSRIVAQDGRIHALEVTAGLAVRYLDSGRHQAAHDVLSAILDTVPADQREAS